jgi:hypothetical protein
MPYDAISRWENEGGAVLVANGAQRDRLRAEEDPAGEDPRAEQPKTRKWALPPAPRVIRRDGSTRR